MWHFLVLCFLLVLANCRPRTTASKSCTQDELFSSLYQEGVEFCESVIDNHCATVSTPAPYTSYDNEEISSYCECVLTEQSTRTDATSVGGFGQPTETEEYNPPGSSQTSLSQASAGSGSGSRTATSTGLESSETATDSISPTGNDGTATRSSRSGDSTSIPAIPSTADGATVSQNNTVTSRGPTSSAGDPVTPGVPLTSSSVSRRPSGSGGSPVPTGSAGSWNSTATAGQTQNNTISEDATRSSPSTSGQSSEPNGSLLPTGSGGFFDTTTTTGQTFNSTSNAANPTTTNPSLTGVPSGSNGLPPLPTAGGGSWNSTATVGNTINGTVAPPGPTTSLAPNSTAAGGSTSFAVSIITGSPAPGPVPSSSGGGPTVPWNTTSSGVGPSGGGGQGNLTILPTGTLSATWLPSNTSVGAFTFPTGSQLSTNGRSLSVNATSPSSGLPASSSQSGPSSAFPGWNSTLSTSLGQITGAAGTSIPSKTRGSGSAVLPSSRSSSIPSGNTTAATTLGTPFGNSTTIPDKPVPTSGGQLNKTSDISTGASSVNATEGSGIPLPTSGDQGNTSSAVITSGAVNSTAVSVTALPTTVGTIGMSNSGSLNFTLATSTLRPNSTGTESTSGAPGTVVGPTGSTTAFRTANGTVPATATPTSISATGGSINGSGTAIPSGGSDATPSGTPVPAANFTEVFRNAAVAQETCYSLPQDEEDGTTRRALVHNSKLRESNVSIPTPYIESIDFDSEGLQPLYMTVRDNEQAEYFLDISNKSRLAIVDASGVSMVLDDQGVRFATNSCRYDVNVTISDMFAQLADLSDTDCSFGNSSVPSPPPVKRAEDIQFNQTLYLEDQCGNTVTRSIRDYPELRIGDTECVDVAVDEVSGRWDFDCTYPGLYSGIIRCQRTVKEDIMDFLLKDAFGGECPDVSTMVSMLANSSSDVLNGESFQAELLSRIDATAEREDIDAVVDAYEGLWGALQEFFIPPGSNTTTPWEVFFSVYNDNRNFEDDICESLHAGEIPLSLNLRAGATYIDAITTLNWAPEAAEPYNITIQDPSSRACCPSSFVASDQGSETCAYPGDAFVGETGCVCGETADGEAIAYEATECSNFEDTCDADDDCSSEGFVCLTGSCCGSGVCVDPYACSQNGTTLVTFDLEDALS